MGYLAKRIKYKANEFGYTAVFEIIESKHKYFRFVVYRYSFCYNQKSNWWRHFEIIICGSKRQAVEHLKTGEGDWRPTTDWLSKSAKIRGWIELKHVPVWFALNLSKP